MENAKYAEFTGKVVEIDKKLDAAMRNVHNTVSDARHTIREMVKDMPRDEIVDWLERAHDDDRVSSQIFHLVCQVSYNEINKRVADIMDAIDKL